MDSGNSGSIQSSSCGDEIDQDYDSRAESNFSSFFNNPPQPTTTTETTYVNSSTFANTHQVFDSLTNYNYMNSLQKQSNSNPNPNPNPFLNVETMWSKGNSARSEQNNNDLSSLLAPSSSSSSSHQQNQAFLLSQLSQTRENVTQQQQQHHSLPLETASAVSRGASLTNDLNNNNSNNNNNNNNNNVGSRNPKKRSRASRRAPTTVLTTDTTNFRAMVQEFTGIPAPPFSSPFPRTRLDLFGNSRSVSSTMNPPPPQPPPYLLRPFAQKIHHSFPPNISSSFPSLENLASSNLNSTTNNNYSLMQNQILGFESMNSSHSQQLAAPPLPRGAQQQHSLEITPNRGSTVFEELGLMSHAHVNNNTNNNNNNNNIGVLHHQNQNMVPPPLSSTDQWEQRRSNINAGDGGGGGGGIVGGEKGQECGVATTTTTRGEGTVESWINCSSSD